MSEYYVGMDETYLRLVHMVKMYGKQRLDRTGTGTRSVFGCMYRVDLQKEFPLITTKKIHFKSVAEELFWMLRGGVNSRELEEKGVSIWKEWATESGYLGPIYGKQWRLWGGSIDQVEGVIKSIKERPYSRRHIISAWNVYQLPDESLSPQENVKLRKMSLAPCHVMYQFYVDDYKLHCMMTQRSADLMLGLPFNIASTALLTHIIAYETGLGVGEVTHSIGDLHIYNNHMDLITEQVKRSPYDAPQLHVIDRPGRTTWDYQMRDVSLVGYQSHPAIKAEISI